MISRLLRAVATGALFGASLVNAGSYDISSDCAWISQSYLPFLGAFANLEIQLESGAAPGH